LFNYTIRRLLFGVLIVFAVVTIIFFIIRLMPGDPAISALGENATEDSIRMLREKWGLNLPLWEQYYNYLVGLVHGDMGYSYSTSRPVIELVKNAFPFTIELSMGSLFFAIIIGIPLGIITSIKRNTIIDYLGRLLSLMGISTPAFFMGILLMLLLSVRFKLFPSMGAGSLSHLVLPAFAGGIGIASYLTRLTRSAILNISRELYVTTARSKGLPEKVVIYKHVLRNALVTVITFLGVYTIVTLGGTVIIEQVFSRPGLGRLIVAAALQRDYMLLQGVLLVYAVIVIFVNVITDLIYAFIDPRIRLT
jgi:ABC-type dipeptide/oligopeptide/nickel transport system permease component